MAKTAYMTPSPKGGLVPLHAFDAETVRGLTFGKTYKVEISEARPRSLGQHRLLFALLKIIRDNAPTDEPLTDKTILNALKLKTGHVEIAKLPSGELIMYPASISFQAMPQEEFGPWFDKAVDVMCRDFVPGLRSEDAKREIEAIAEGKAAA